MSPAGFAVQGVVCLHIGQIPSLLEVQRAAPSFAQASTHGRRASLQLFILRGDERNDVAVKSNGTEHLGRPAFAVPQFDGFAPQALREAKSGGKKGFGVGDFPQRSAQALPHVGRWLRVGEQVRGNQGSAAIRERK